MSKRKTSRQWMSLRCDASMQSPSHYGRNLSGAVPPAPPEGYARCPVCWKVVRLIGTGAKRRFPTHNVDHEQLQAKENAMNAAIAANQAKRDA